MHLSSGATLLHADLRTIFEAALAAVDPSRLIVSVLTRRRDRLELSSGVRSRPAGFALRGPIGVVGAGKAAAGMAGAFDELCGTDIAVSGIVIAPSRRLDVQSDRGRRIAVVPGEHPIPGPLGEANSARLLAFFDDRRIKTFVCLLSGGASSLLVSPLPPLTLADKQVVTRLLLASGASIDEINCVRKHLSDVKGGRLLSRAAGRRVVSLILSDVVRDDPATIGSGPTVPDSTTYEQAMEVLRARAVLQECPASVREVLERGRRGEIPETVRPESTEARLAIPIVIGSNAVARAGAAAAARRLGYAVEVRPEPLEGDTMECAQAWFRDLVRSEPRDRPWCCIAGGETTVRVRGNGKGGRNQEFALALSKMADGLNVAVLSAGTDGLDGPTEAAGAFVNGSTERRAARLGLCADEYLRKNDSFRFFEQLGDLFITGPTGTNVMDLKIALFGAPSSA